MIKVYSKPNCPQCEATKRQLDKLGIAYEEIDITRHRAELARLVAMSYRVAPVVETGDDAWSGYQPEKIRSLVSAAGRPRPHVMPA